MSALPQPTRNRPMTRIEREYARRASAGEMSQEQIGNINRLYTEARTREEQFIQNQIKYRLATEFPTHFGSGSTGPGLRGISRETLKTGIEAHNPKHSSESNRHYKGRINTLIDATIASRSRGTQAMRDIETQELAKIEQRYPAGLSAERKRQILGLEPQSISPLENRGYQIQLEQYQELQRPLPMMDMPYKNTRLNTTIERPTQDKSWTTAQLTEAYQTGNIYINQIMVSGELNNVFMPEGPPTRNVLIPIGGDENYFRN